MFHGFFNSPLRVQISGRSRAPTSIYIIYVLTSNPLINQSVVTENGRAIIFPSITYSIHSINGLSETKKNQFEPIVPDVSAFNHTNFSIIILVYTRDQYEQYMFSLVDCVIYLTIQKFL